MRRRAAWAILAILLLALTPPAVAAELCATEAHVAWVVDHETATVSGAHVEVPGCADGDVVGLQLLTDDGDLPSDPILTEALDERAAFDLRPFDVHIEPVIGVRVLLTDRSTAEPGYEITVERRFFNRAGNEQRGLRETSTLFVPLGETYTVAGPPARYQAVGCGEPGVEPTDDLVGEGPGTVEPDASGRHLACFQLITGAPNDGGVDVLDDALTRDPSAGGTTDTTTVLATATSADGALPRTGFDLWSLLALVMVLGVSGWAALRTGREEGS